ncbi:MAG: hypothetical protein ACD_39C01829G0002 [uncultured bacterium]|nr:MAG: hypothetical protein ACD_39C01829G0002 [uncultured bacterium]
MAGQQIIGAVNIAKLRAGNRSVTQLERKFSNALILQSLGRKSLLETLVNRNNSQTEFVAVETVINPADIRNFEIVGIPEV